MRAWMCCHPQPSPPNRPLPNQPSSFHRLPPSCSCVRSHWLCRGGTQLHTQTHCYNCILFRPERPKKAAMAGSEQPWLHALLAAAPARSLAERRGPARPISHILPHGCPLSPLTRDYSDSVSLRPTFPSQRTQHSVQIDRTTADSGLDHTVLGAVASPLPALAHVSRAPPCRPGLAAVTSTSPGPAIHNLL
jgi:hypothetical protein